VAVVVVSVPEFFGNLAPTNPETELTAAVMFAGLLRMLIASLAN
jgi:hypothetical protein